MAEVGAAADLTPGALAVPAGLAAHGTITLGIATVNLAKDAQQTSSGGPKASDAPGVTAGGQATNEHGQKRGPSGKPQANNVSKNTREGANNAANKGSGTIEDPPQGGKEQPHFHTKRGTGKKKRDNTHYNYPQ
jgi:hypothetical protein